MIKKSRDWYAGREKAKGLDQSLNNYFALKQSPLRIKPISGEIKHIGPIGLKRLIYHKDHLCSKCLPVIYMDRATGYYLKIPKRYIPEPSEYLDVLASHNFYALPVDSKKELFGVPISFDTIRSHWSYKLAPSQGNRNRLMIHGKISSISLYELGERDLFHGPIEEVILPLLSHRR